MIKKSKKKKIRNTLILSSFFSFFLNLSPLLLVYIIDFQNVFRQHSNMRHPVQNEFSPEDGINFSLPPTFFYFSFSNLFSRRRRVSHLSYTDNKIQADASLSLPRRQRGISLKKSYQKNNQKNQIFLKKIFCMQNIF